MLGRVGTIFCSTSTVVWYSIRAGKCRRFVNYSCPCAQSCVSTFSVCTNSGEALWVKGSLQMGTMSSSICIISSYYKHFCFSITVCILYIDMRRGRTCETGVNAPPPKQLCHSVSMLKDKSYLFHHSPDRKGSGRFAERLEDRGNCKICWLCCRATEDAYRSKLSVAYLPN